jgi:hypothetical protein
MSVRVLDRAVDLVTTVLDLGEDRRRAWLAAAVGLAITVACWWIALTTDPTGPIDARNWSRVVSLRMLGSVLVVLAGPFIMVAALLQAVSRKGEPDTWNETGLLFNQGARVGEQRRRRMILSAALTAVVNAIVLFVARN